MRRLIFIVMFAAVGCGGAKAKPDGQVTDGGGQTEPADLDEVDPEALADSPCGNPDWSKLPGQPTGSEQ